MNTLVYLAYGRGPHQLETLYSLLTLHRFEPEHFQQTRICVVTDAPDAFAGLGADLLPVPPDTLAEWMGPHKFNHRAKILALQAVARRYGGRLALIDGDTYFRQPPGPIFQRIRPGHTVMHMREGKLRDSTHDMNHRAGEILAAGKWAGASGHRYDGGPESMQWNAGVVGVHAADIDLTHDVLALVDALLSKAYIAVWEQIAFSLVLARRTRLASVRDVVFHYHVSPDRPVFRTQLPRLLADTAGLPLPERARVLYGHRPDVSTRTRMRIVAKDIANGLGLVPRRDRCICM